MSLFRITQTSEMPQGASSIWQALYRAILGALQGFWGEYDITTITNATGFKCNKLGAMAWCSFSGSGNKSISLPFEYVGYPLVSVDGGSATVSGSSITVIASGDWSISLYGRYKEA